MIYILMIWTVVGIGGDRHYTNTKIDWRSLGEFHREEDRIGKKTALEMCEAAARQLGLKSDNYRCIRSK